MKDLQAIFDSPPKVGAYHLLRFQITDGSPVVWQRFGLEEHPIHDARCRYHLAKVPDTNAGTDHPARSESRKSASGRHLLTYRQLYYDFRNVMGTSHLLKHRRTLTFPHSRYLAHGRRADRNVQRPHPTHAQAEPVPAAVRARHVERFREEGRCQLDDRRQ